MNFNFHIILTINNHEDQRCRSSLEITHYSYLLQFASDVITICAYLHILQNAAAFITKCVGWIYYKMLHPLLQNAAIVITKCVTYYKMRHYYKMPQNNDTVALVACDYIFNVF